MDEALDVRLQLLSECVGGEASYVRADVLAKRLCEEAGGVDHVKSRCLAPRAAPPAAAAHATAEPTFFARPEAELLAMTTFCPRSCGSSRLGTGRRLGDGVREGAPRAALLIAARDSKKA